MKRKNCIFCKTKLQQCDSGGKSCDNHSDLGTIYFNEGPFGEYRTVSFELLYNNIHFLFYYYIDRNLYRIYLLRNNGYYEIIREEINTMMIKKLLSNINNIKRKIDKQLLIL